MKKKYMPPSVETVSVSPYEMIASSIPLNRGGQEEYEVFNESDLLSRGHRSIWDDYEE